MHEVDTSMHTSLHTCPKCEDTQHKYKHTAELSNIVQHTQTLAATASSNRVDELDKKFYLRQPFIAPDLKALPAAQVCWKYSKHDPVLLRLAQAGSGQLALQLHQQLVQLACCGQEASLALPAHSMPVHNIPRVICRHVCLLNRTQLRKYVELT